MFLFDLFMDLDREREFFFAVIFLSFRNYSWIIFGSFCMFLGFYGLGGGLFWTLRNGIILSLRYYYII